MLVIGFAESDSGGINAGAAFDRDVADFKSRMDALGEGGHPEFVVVDFSNGRMTDWENGRTVVSLLMGTRKHLKAQGGGSLVCNHPAQLNSNRQHLFQRDKMIAMYRSRREALDAALSRQKC